MQTPHTTMGTLSKVAIAIPIVILVSAFIFRPSKTGSQLAKKKNIKPTLSYPTPTIKKYGFNNLQVPKNTISTGSAMLDLKGPYSCSYDQDGVKAQAYIKNKNIYVEFNNKGEREKVLVKGDCVYNWDEGEKTGKKTCEISQYLSLFESLSQFGIVDMESIFAMMAQSRPSGVPAISGAPSLNTLTKSCVKGEVKDTVFTMPPGITFTEGSLLEPTKTK